MTKEEFKLIKESILDDKDFIKEVSEKVQQQLINEEKFKENARIKAVIQASSLPWPLSK